MVVLTPDGGWDDEKLQKSFLEKLLSGTGATIKTVTALGKKHLAYPIKKQAEGFYLLVQVEGIIKAGDLEKQTRLVPGVLRYLLTALE